MERRSIFLIGMRMIINQTILQNYALVEKHVQLYGLAQRTLKISSGMIIVALLKNIRLNIGLEQIENWAVTYAKKISNTKILWDNSSSLLTIHIRVYHILITGHLTKPLCGKTGYNW